MDVTQIGKLRARNPAERTRLRSRAPTWAALGTRTGGCRVSDRVAANPIALSAITSCDHPSQRSPASTFLAVGAPRALSCPAPGERGEHAAPTIPRRHEPFPSFPTTRPPFTLTTDHFHPGAARTSCSHPSKSLFFPLPDSSRSLRRADQMVSTDRGNLDHGHRRKRAAAASVSVR
jgi:hypothetical protein